MHVGVVVVAGVRVGVVFKYKFSSRWRWWSCAEQIFSLLLFFVFFQLLETSRAGQTETFRPVNGSKSTRLTSRFKALGFESHRLTIPLPVRKYKRI